MKTVMKVVTAMLVIGVAIAGSVVYRNIRLDRGLSALKAQDYSTTHRELKLLSRLGDNKAQEVLALMHAYGWGTPKDQGQALELFKRSGASLSSHAYDVADSYAQGIRGVSKDDREAVFWFTAAADAGSKNAALRLAAAYSEGALGLQKDLEKAQLWHKRAEQL